MIDNLTNKRLLIMGGVRKSCEIVKSAHRLGCFVAVTDYYPISNSPAKQVADAAYDVSTIDVDAMVSLIKQEKMDGVIVGFNDMMLPFYADICEKSGLPCYGSRYLFEIFTDKKKYKPLLRKYGIPTIDDYKVNIEDIDNLPDNIVFPVLIKPSDGSGSQGVSICNSKLEIKIAVIKALKYSKKKDILVERYIEGDEVTVNWIFQDGQSFLTSIANRHVKNNQPGVIPLPVGYTYPSYILPVFKKKFEEKCKKLFKDVGIQNGMMFMQCKLVDDECIVYDIGFRLTGTMDYINISDICGYNPMDMMIHCAITGSMGEPDLSSKIDPFLKGKYGFNVSTLSSSGKIADIRGVDEVKRFEHVIDSIPAHVPGETISEEMVGHLSQIAVRTFGTVNKFNELYPLMKKIENTIDIISENGSLLNLSGIEEKDITVYLPGKKDNL